MFNLNYTALIKNLCPPIVWKFLKKLKKKKYYGRDNLVKKIEKYLNYNSGFYIELGANNGIEQSNTYFLEKEKNWSGILIEPILHKYLECKKNRSQKNKFYCTACVSKKFDQDYVKLLYSDLRTIPTNLESDISNYFDHANFSNTKTDKENQVEAVEFLAKAKTLNQIMDNANAPKLIDFLSIDVEGAEKEILNGINFDKYQFKFILIESRNIELTSKILNLKNYSQIEKPTDCDYLFKKNSI